VHVESYVSKLLHDRSLRFSAPRANPADDPGIHGLGPAIS